MSHITEVTHQPGGISVTVINQHMRVRCHPLPILLGRGNINISTISVGHNVTIQHPGVRLIAFEINNVFLHPARLYGVAAESGVRSHRER